MVYDESDLPAVPSVAAGIDIERVTSWFAEHIPVAVPPLRFELITGGRSNLTYRVHDESGARWVLRRPPTGHVLASAHDVVREFRILDLLAGSPVLVPPVLGCCADHAVTGADFYVMENVDGIVPDDPATAAAIPQESRAAASRNIVDTLAAVHAVDTTTGPLAEQRRPGSYLERQLRRWHRQLTAGGVGPGYADATGRALDDLPYYQAFALWRLAAIAEGVAARFRAGVMGEQDIDVTELSERPARLAESARAVLVG